MLRVEPVEDPEERVEISVMDVGNLIHQSFDALVREAGDTGHLPGFGAPWSERQRERLQAIGAQLADDYEAAGKTGHPLLWARARAHILAVLDWMIDDDNVWRAQQDARVVASELVFGLRGEPPLGVRVDGGTVLFRGAVDKIDQRRDGTLLVTDIKSGGARAFKDLSEANPDACGEKLQLPVYAHAARAAYGDDDTPVEALYWFVRRDRGRVHVPLTDLVAGRYATTVGVLASSLASGAFPQRPPEKPDFRWVQCAYCNPDGLGHAGPRRWWEAKRFSPALVGFTALVEPDAVPERMGEEGAQS
jgi:ATP-dependent helicase/DNAse subunit B